MQDRVARLESILEASLMLNSSLHIDEVLENVMQKAMEVMKAEAGSVWLLEGDFIEPRVAGGPRADGLKGLKLKKGEGIAGQVIDSGQPVLVSDIKNDPHWARRFDASTGFTTTSMMCVPLSARGKTIGCLQLLNKRNGLFDEEDLKLVQAFACQAAIVIENSTLYSNQRTLFLSIIQTLVSTLDARDPYTRGHSERVSKYSVEIGKALGFSRDDVEKLREAALLHDIGKIGIRDDILLHEGSLSPEAWEKLKEHPNIGARILQDVKPLELVEYLREGALYHQEKYDGTGYPLGAKGEEIPLVARIISIGDTYDAMTTDRPYRKGLSPEIALKEIEKYAGIQFDEKLVRVFVEVMRKKQGGEDNV